MAAILTVAHGWYVLSVLGMKGVGSLAEVSYQRAAIVAVVMVVVQAAVSHAVVGATMPPERASTDIKRHSPVMAATVRHQSATMSGESSVEKRHIGRGPGKT